MSLFLTLQSTYDQVKIGLFNDNQCIDESNIEKKAATKLLIVTLDALLKRNSNTMKDLAFCVVYQGPAPFTTLRVVIATANGLAFTRELPLVAIDGLKASITEFHTGQSPLIVLLDAFSGQVYYAIADAHGIIKNSGCDDITAVLTTVTTLFSTGSLLFAGSGAVLYEQNIIAKMGARAHIDGTKSMASLQTVAQQGYECWQKGITSYQITPLYLKPTL